MMVVDECNDPNAICLWNRFKREVIKKPNYYKNHFSRTEKAFLKLLETALDFTIQTKNFVASIRGHNIS